MHTRLLMGLNAAFMGAIGLAASFLPQELLIRTDLPPVPALVVLVQVTGALYLGFAYLNWMARGVLIGGIYARPLALGNFLHHILVAMTLIKALPQFHAIPAITLAFVYAVFAAWFGSVIFASPIKRAHGNGRSGQE